MPHLPDDIEHRRRTAAEMLLDSEGLTDDLQDAAAKKLLAWGLAQAERLITATTDQDPDQATSGLRRVMRRVNSLVARQASLDDAEFAAEVNDLMALAAARLHQRRLPETVAAQSLLLERAGLDEETLVERLVRLLGTGEAAPWENTPSASGGIPSERAGNIDGPSAAWAITCAAEGDDETDEDILP
ncbi:MAG: hypothetical protein ACOYZ7_03200 [Chloroflexota bacterium]